MNSGSGLGRKIRKGPGNLLNMLSSSCGLLILLHFLYLIREKCVSCYVERGTALEP